MSLTRSILISLSAVNISGPEKVLETDDGEMSDGEYCDYISCCQTAHKMVKMVHLMVDIILS